MSSQLELAAEERAVSGKGQLRQLRHQGMVPANVYGGHQPSVSLQVNGVAFQKLLGHGGNTVILSLKVGTQPAVQALIKQVQHDPRGGGITHVDFYRVAATEKLKTSVQLQFINEAGAASLSDITVLRPLNEVMVECLPGDLPAAIQVDLSELKEVGAVIRVGNLVVGPGVTILTDHGEMVAGLHQRTPTEKAEGVEAKAETAPAAGTPAGG
ncbi:MAG: 50S ribosomal protein L25 [Chloroflexi bacterium]|nr:50S ribosomal protein L25 [Chloroflexota bacterium]